MVRVGGGMKIEKQQPRFLTVADVARMLGRTEGAVRQMQHRRQIPFRRVGRRVVFIEAEIEMLINESPGCRLDEVRDEYARRL